MGPKRPNPSGSDNRSGEEALLSKARIPVKKRKLLASGDSADDQDQDSNYSDSEDSDDGRILTVPLTESNVPDGGSPGDSYINSSNDAVASRAIELDYNEPSIDLYGAANSTSRSHLDLVRPGMVDASKCNMHEHRWERMFELLLQAEQTLGSCKVPLSYEVTTADGSVLKLGLWLGTQRQLYRKGQLRKDKLERLQALVDAGKMDWGEVKVLADNARWNEMYDHLMRFYETNGHCNVPERFVLSLPDGQQVKLGRWLDRQRGFIKRSKMRADRLAKLQALVDQGLLFADALEEDERKWLCCYEALVAYGNEHGDCNVPHSYVIKLPNGSMAKLGIWLATQRHLQKHPGKLRPERLRKLQDLVDRKLLKWGDIQMGKDQKWELSFAALLQFDIEHGNMNVPRNHETSLGDGSRVKLFKWLSKQMTANREGKLKPERQARLQELVNSGKLSWDMAGDGLSSWNHHNPTQGTMHNRLAMHGTRQGISHGQLGQGMVGVQHLPLSGDPSLQHDSMQHYGANDTDDSDSDIEELDEDQVDALMHVAAANADV